MSASTDGTIPGPFTEPLIVPEKGYRVEPFLDASDIEALLGLHGDTTLNATTDHYNTARIATAETKRHIFEVVKARVEEKLRVLAPGYRMYLASFVIKKAGGARGKLPMHPDPSVVNHGDDIGINVWIPLCDVDEQNGCLHVVEYSPRFGHIAAVPPMNPSPYDAVRKELEANYLTPVPMKAGTAFVFDTRTLHATEPNKAATDRVALFINMTPEGKAPRHYFWNPEKPAQLDVYDVDTEFVIQLDSSGYPDAEQRAQGKFVGMIDYAPVAWTKADVEQKLLKSLKASAPSTAALVAGVVNAYAPDVVVLAPVVAAKSGFWSRLPKIFSSDSSR